MLGAVHLPTNAKYEEIVEGLPRTALGYAATGLHDLGSVQHGIACTYFYHLGLQEFNEK